MISAMDTPQTDAVHQDLILATLTKNLEIFSENINLLNQVYMSLTRPTEGKSKLNSHVDDLYNLQEKNKLSLTQNQNALSFYNGCLAKEAAANEKTRLLAEDIRKDINERAEASKRRQEEERGQSVKSIQDTLNTVGTTAAGIIQKAYSDIKNIDKKLPEVQAKLKQSQEACDNHNRKLPYILGGVLFFIIGASVFITKVFAPQ